MIGGIEERSSRQGRSLAGCKSPYRQLRVFRRLAYPMRGEATNRVLLGRKSPGCPAEVFAAVGTIWGASKLGGRNITKYLRPRKSGPARSRHSRDRCGKPTHFPVGKADDTVEATRESTRWYRRGRGSSIQGQTVGDNVGKLPWAAVSSRQGWKSGRVRVPVPSIACIRAVSISGVCGGNKAQ